MKQAVSLVGSWKDAQNRKMQFLSDGTMFIDGSKYLYQVKGKKLLITASDMKLKAKFKYAGGALFTTINRSTNRWFPDDIVSTPKPEAASREIKPDALGEASDTAPEEIKEVADALQCEELLKKEFGLTLEDNKWVFYGQVNDEKATLFDADISYGVIKSVREKLNDPQFQFCIVTTAKVTIVFNKPRPVCLITGLSAEGTSGVIAKAIKDGGTCRIYNGAFIISF